MPNPTTYQRALEHEREVVRLLQHRGYVTPHLVDDDDAVTADALAPRREAEASCPTGLAHLIVTPGLGLTPQVHAIVEAELAELLGCDVELWRSAEQRAVRVINAGRSRLLKSR